LKYAMQKWKIQAKTYRGWENGGRGAGRTCGSGTTTADKSHKNAHSGAGGLLGGRQRGLLWVFLNSTRKRTREKKREGVY